MILTTQALGLYFIALVSSFLVYACVRVMSRAFYGRR